MTVYVISKKLKFAFFFRKLPNIDRITEPLAVKPYLLRCSLADLAETLFSTGNSLLLALFQMGMPCNIRYKKKPVRDRTLKYLRHI